MELSCIIQPMYMTQWRLCSRWWLGSCSNNSTWGRGFRLVNTTLTTLFCGVVEAWSLLIMFCSRPLNGCFVFSGGMGNAQICTNAFLRSHFKIMNNVFDVDCLVYNSWSLLSLSFDFKWEVLRAGNALCSINKQLTGVKSSYRSLRW